MTLEPSFKDRVEFWLCNEMKKETTKKQFWNVDCVIENNLCILPGFGATNLIQNSACSLWKAKADELETEMGVWDYTHTSGMTIKSHTFNHLRGPFLFNLSRFQEYGPKIIHQQQITAKNLDRAESYLSGLKGFPFFPAVFPEGERQLLAFGTVRSEDATLQNLANVEVVRGRGAFVHPQLGPWDDACRDSEKKHST